MHLKITTAPLYKKKARIPVTTVRLRDNKIVHDHLFTDAEGRLHLTLEGDEYQVRIGAGLVKRSVETFKLPPAPLTTDFQIADQRTFKVFHHAIKTETMTLGQGNGDGKANRGEQIAILFPDGNAYRAAELIADDDCIDLTTRISDNWAEYDWVGASAKYTLARISRTCPNDHIIKILAKVIIPNKPNHELREFTMNLPITPTPITTGFWLLATSPRLLPSNFMHPQQQDQPKPPIPGVKRLIAIGSGKGGVGKTTVSVNLAISLARLGRTVGLLDADVYGPNVPLMFGVSHAPNAIDERIQPLEKYGVRLMSMGFLNPGDKPLVWRGPMLHSVIQQFLRGVDWGELDYLLIDLPPGTGDVALSLIQTAPLSGRRSSDHAFRRVSRRREKSHQHVRPGPRAHPGPGREHELPDRPRLRRTHRRLRPRRRQAHRRQNENPLPGRNRPRPPSPNRRRQRHAGISAHRRRRPPWRSLSSASKTNRTTHRIPTHRPQNHHRRLGIPKCHRPKPVPRYAGNRWHRL